MRLSIPSFMQWLFGSALALYMPAATASTLKVLHTFHGGNTDGAGPLGGLVLLDHVFYGTTSVGGAHQSGTIFSIDETGYGHTKDHGYKLLYSFKGGLNDGAGPRAGLTVIGDQLYGTTANGGQADNGTIFTYSNAAGYVHLYSFKGSAGQDGAQPEAQLIAVDGVLYGTTLNGGVAGCFDKTGCGTIFSFDPTAPVQSAEKILYSFKGKTDGRAPLAQLTVMNKTFYGTTSSGGVTKDSGGAECFAAEGCGTIFKFNFTVGSQTFNYQQLYKFPGRRLGAHPITGLTAANGVLYGNTRQGGGSGCAGNGCGTVFKFDPETATPHYLFNQFGTMKNGMSPDGNLLFCVHRGETAPGIDRPFIFGPSMGGGNGSGSGVNPGSPSGTIYEIDLLSPHPVATVLYNFSGRRDGSRPIGAIIKAESAYFGVTYRGGGKDDSGTLFEFYP